MKQVFFSVQIDSLPAIGDEIDYINPVGVSGKMSVVGEAVDGDVHTLVLRATFTEAFETDQYRENTDFQFHIPASISLDTKRPHSADFGLVWDESSTTPGMTTVLLIGP